MSDDTETSLIGYDPLAWLDQAGEEEELVKDFKQLSSEVETHNNSELQSSEPLAETDPVIVTDHLSLVLEPVLTIRIVQSLHQQFCSALNAANIIEIDASKILTIDTACLQLLIIFKRTAVKMEKQVVIDFPSEKFIEASNLLGISEMLEVNQAFAGLF